ncbi:MAG: EMC3/TMCO1 family protein [Candidatus Parvarchaeota archaeon]|nr:EMC3/TMCO1 family protein [Candidatus Parvarchaeota archaeon]
MIWEAWVVVILGIVVGVSGQLAYLFLVDQNLVRDLKIKMRELQIQLKGKSRTDPDYMELQSQLLKHNATMMKHTMKPTYVTFIPFLIVFLILEFYVSTVPIAIGQTIPLSVAGTFNGSLFSSNNCLKLNNGYNTTMHIVKSEDFNSIVNSNDCAVTLLTANKSYNVSLAGLIGSGSVKTYTLGPAKLSFTPQPLVFFYLPFSIPFIGNQLNWFWIYFILTLVSSIVLRQILVHYKLIY